MTLWRWGNGMPWQVEQRQEQGKQKHCIRTDSVQPDFTGYSERTHITDEKTNEQRDLFPQPYEQISSVGIGECRCLVTPVHPNPQKEKSGNGTVSDMCRSPAWVEIAFICRPLQISLFLDKSISSPQVSGNLELTEMLIGFARHSSFLPSCTLPCPGCSACSFPLPVQDVTQRWNHSVHFESSKGCQCHTDSRSVWGAEGRKCGGCWCLQEEIHCDCCFLGWWFSHLVHFLSPVPLLGQLPFRSLKMSLTHKG